MTGEKSECNRWEFEFLIIAYQEARAEILERFRQRERIIQVYILGSISLGAALLVTVRSNGDVPSFVLVASPILSLSTALLVAANNRTLEVLSDYIRVDVNDSLLALRAWAPHWDTYNRTHRNLMVGNSARSLLRNVANVVTLHFPSIMVVVAHFLLVAASYDHEIGLTSLQTGAFGLSVLIMVSALIVTFDSISPLTSAGVYQINAPAWYRKKHNIQRTDNAVDEK